MGFFAFLVTVFLTAFLAETFFLTTFFAFFFTTFFAFLTTFFFGLGSSLTSLKDPLTGTSFLAANIFLMASLALTLALSALAILLLAKTYLRMAWRDEPPRSFRALMAPAIMTANGGCAGLTAGFLALTTFLAGAAASAMVAMLRLLELQSPC